MKTTIDAAGRLFIPKEIRRQAGLGPGTSVNVEWRDGTVHIEPAFLDVRLERRGRLLVAVPETPIEPMTVEDVEETRRALADERALS